MCLGDDFEAGRKKEGIRKERENMHEPSKMHGAVRTNRKRELRELERDKERQRESETLFFLSFSLSLSLSLSLTLSFCLKLGNHLEAFIDMAIPLITSISLLF